MAPADPVRHHDAEDMLVPAATSSSAEAPATGEVTVLLADDHPLFLDGLRRAVDGHDEFRLLATATEGHEALRAIRELHPGVAVLDVRMPGLDGVQVVNAITRERLETRALLLTAFAEDDVVYRALAAGARGYLLKETSRAEILAAIAAVAAGEVVLSPSLQKLLATEIRMRESAERSLLTPREQEVLRLISSGKRAPEVAAELHLSPTTVKTHLQNIYAKLGVTDRAAAVAAAMRRGLIE